MSKPRGLIHELKRWETTKLLHTQRFLNVTENRCSKPLYTSTQQILDAFTFKANQWHDVIKEINTASWALWCAIWNKIVINIYLLHTRVCKLHALKLTSTQVVQLFVRSLKKINVIRFSKHRKIATFVYS